MNIFKFFCGYIEDKGITHITPFLYEPMRQNRFIVYFPNEFQIEPFYVRSVSGPRFNSQTFSWETITLELITPIGGYITGNLYRISYEYENFLFHISLLDPTGIVVEKWEIIVESYTVDFGELNYESDEIRTVKLHVQPSNCVIIPWENLLYSSHFCSDIYIHAIANPRKVWGIPKQPDNFEELSENEFIGNVLDVVGSYDLLMGDMCRLNSYGIVKRNGMDDIVMIDYGITGKIYDSFYR